LFVLKRISWVAIQLETLKSRRTFFAHAAFPAKGKPSFIGVMEGIPLHEISEIFPSPHPITFGASAPGNPQLAGLIGANDHLFAISRQPSIHDPFRLCHRILLSARAGRLSDIEIPDGRNFLSIAHFLSSLPQESNASLHPERADESADRRQHLAS
jgi:hypothetical protein